MNVDFRAVVTFAGLLRACLAVKHKRTHKLSESLNLKYMNCISTIHNSLVHSIVSHSGLVNE